MSLIMLYRPLKTQKMRDGEDQEKLKKYPKTTIRIRMPDHTIVQAVFQSKEKGKKVNDTLFLLKTNNFF